jgi:hypothetical protein
MTGIIRVGLPDVDVLTETDPDKFALISDEDNVLIKEFLHGYKNIQPSSNYSIDHNLGYIPMAFVYGRESSGVWSLIVSNAADAYSYITLSTTQLTITNGRGDRAVAFIYYIFYDQMI